jgi:cold shock protein
MTGTLKWYDPAKGYGFISTDTGPPDTLLHATVLRRSGVQMMLPGARVKFEAQRTPKGLQCQRILAIDNTCASPVLGLPRTHALVRPTSDWELATVKWFNRLNGFGFLTRGEDTPDIFIHTEVLRWSGIVDMRPGDLFLLRYGHGPKGLMASEIKPSLSGNAASIADQDEQIAI